MAVNDSQQRLLRTIITGIPGLLALKNKELRYEVVNPAFCQFLGKAPDQIAGRTDAELLPEGEAAAVRHQDQLVLKSGLARSQEESMTGAAGSCWLDVARIPVLNEDGDAIGLLFFARDITALKSREGELQAGLARQAGLEQASQEAESRVHACEDAMKAVQAAHTAKMLETQSELEAVQALANEAARRQDEAQSHLRQREDELAALLQRQSVLQQAAEEGKILAQRAQEALNAALAERDAVQSRLTGQAQLTAKLQEELGAANARAQRMESELELSRGRREEALALARRLADTLE